MPNFTSGPDGQENLRLLLLELLERRYNCALRWPLYRAGAGRLVHMNRIRLQCQRDYFRDTR